MGTGASSNSEKAGRINVRPAPKSAVNKPAVVDQETLVRYIDLEQEIALAEKTSPITLLIQKREQLTSIDERITDQNLILEDLKEITSETFKEKIEQLAGQECDDHTREKMAALHSQEIARAELTTLQEQKKSLEEEIQELDEKSVHLQGLYDEQEKLLDEIFGGSYGSAAENGLEMQLDQHEQLRNRIVEANFKWRQAQMMIDYAYKQLEFAVAKWGEVEVVPQDDMESRYTLASETRNNLVAAAQNITGAQRYLSNVEFPYCTPSEVTTLNKATAYIFTDMQTPSRHEHAMSCYSVTSKRCGALLGWISQVVAHTIAKDLADVNKKVKDTSMELRAERVRLIKIKVKEVLGKDVDIKLGEMDTDVDVDLNFNALAKTEGIDPNFLNQMSDEELADWLKNSKEDLAPPPSDQDIGYQVEEISKQFMEDRDRIDNLNNQSKNKVSNNLEKKLAERRIRRARKNMEDKEIDNLSKTRSNGD